MLTHKDPIRHAMTHADRDHPHRRYQLEIYGQNGGPPLIVDVKDDPVLGYRLTVNAEGNENHGREVFLNPCLINAVMIRWEPSRIIL